MCVEPILWPELPLSTSAGTAASFLLDGESDPPVSFQVRHATAHT